MTKPQKPWYTRLLDPDLERVGAPLEQTGAGK